MSFPKAPRFTANSAGDVPPVGSYNLALESHIPAPKFPTATRFRDSHAGCSTPGGTFRLPPVPLHASKELLKRRLFEMAQHLEERDMLIGQLRVSKGKLSTRVIQLEQLLRGLSRKVSARNETLHSARKPKGGEASMTSQQDIEEAQALLKELGETDMTEEAFPEVRLSKGTSELKDELDDMIDKMNADDVKAGNTGLMEAYDQENASFKANVFLEQELKSLNDKLTNMVIEKQELEKNVAEINTEKSSLQKKIEDAEAKCTDLHRQVICHKEECATKQAEVEQLIHENDLLKREVQSLTDCKHELNAIMDQVKAEKQELEEKIAETCKEKASLEVNNQNLEDKHAELNQELVCQKQENTAMNSRIEQLVLENDLLKSEVKSLTDSKCKLNAIMDQVKAEKQELEEKIAETCNEKASLEANNQNLAAKHAKLNQELVCQKQENTAMHSQIEQLVLEKDLLKSEVRSLADCKCELNAIMDQMKVEKQELEDKITEACKEKASLEANNEDLLTQHTQLHQELVSQKQENAAMLSRIEQLVLENEVLKKEAQSCKQELSALNIRLSYVKLEKENIEKKVAELQLERAAMEKSLEGLKCDVDKLCHEAMQHQEEKAMLCMKMDEVAEKNEALKADVQILEDLKISWEQERSLMTNSIKGLQSDLDEAYCEVAELKSSVAHLHNEISIHEQLKQDMLKQLDDFADILTLKTSLEEQLASAVLEVDSLRSSNAEFTREKAALEDANRVASNNIAEILKERKQLKEVIELCHKRREAIEDELSDATNNLNIWKQKAEALYSENRRQDEVLTDCAAQLRAAMHRADKYKCVCSELDRQKRELCDQLKQVSEELTQVKDEQVSNLNEQLNSMAADAERWKASFEALQMRVAPFQEQLELYEMEKQLLEKRNEATESELSKLHKKVSEVMGHQNHRQKIHYLSNLLKERHEFKQELHTLREKTLKQTKEITKLKLQLSQSMKQGQKAMVDQSTKENMLPKPPT